MDDFLRHWFGGFQASLDQIDAVSRQKIFRECGKACSNSYTKSVYRNAVAESSNDHEFIAELKKTFREMEIEVVEPDHQYLITYKYCACDLVAKGYVNSPYLCDCSRNNLICNWESRFGEGKVEVELIQTILDGADCCKFKVKVLREP